MSVGKVALGWSLKISRTPVFDFRWRSTSIRNNRIDCPPRMCVCETSEGLRDCLVPCRSLIALPTTYEEYIEGSRASAVRYGLLSIFDCQRTGLGGRTAGDAPRDYFDVIEREISWLRHICRGQRCLLRISCQA